MSNWPAAGAQMSPFGGVRMQVIFSVIMPDADPRAEATAESSQ